MEEPKTDTGTGRRTMDKYLKTLFGLDVGKNCNMLQREEVGEHLHVFSHIRLHIAAIYLSDPVLFFKVG